MRAGLAEFHVRHLLLQRTAGARARLPRLPGKAERRGSGLHLYRTRAEPDHRETQLALRTPVRIADCGAANPGRRIARPPFTLKKREARANVQVFLTGATGYIGSAVAEALSNAGYAVVGLARSDDQVRTLAAKGLGAHRGDLRDPASLAEGARNADAVIHTALAAAADTGQVDRAAVEAIVRALSQFNRPFIYTSGCWVVGNTGGKRSEEHTSELQSPCNLVCRLLLEKNRARPDARGTRTRERGSDRHPQRTTTGCGTGSYPCSLIRNGEHDLPFFFKYGRAHGDLPLPPATGSSH